MKAALDVAYEEGFGYAAAVAFQDWSDAEVIQEELVVVSGVQPYQLGASFSENCRVCWRYCALCRL